MSVDVGFIGKQKGKMICELRCILANRGDVPYTIENLHFNLRAMCEDDEVVTKDRIEGTDINIRGQAYFETELIDFRSWKPVGDESYATLFPKTGMVYRYQYPVEEKITFLLLHGVLDFGHEGGLQIRADKAVAVPRSVEPATAGGQPAVSQFEVDRPS